MPASVHPVEDWPRWFGSAVVGHREVWVAEADGALVGLLVLDEAFLDHLYVRPGQQRRGVGTALLDLAKARRPGGFSLWVFETNGPAIALYERCALRLVQRGDGSGNEEGAPDRRYCWP